MNSTGKITKCDGHATSYSLIFYMWCDWCERFQTLGLEHDRKIRAADRSPALTSLDAQPSPPFPHCTEMDPDMSRSQGGSLETILENEDSEKKTVMDMIIAELKES